MWLNNDSAEVQVLACDAELSDSCARNLRHSGLSSNSINIKPHIDIPAINPTNNGDACLLKMIPAALSNKRMTTANIVI